MKNKWVPLLLVMIWLAAGCAPKARDYEQISRTERLVARFSHVTAENSPKHLAAAYFAQASRDLTNGRIETQVYPNSQLYRDGDELAALQEGAIHFVAVAPSKLVQFDPAWQVYDLPYLFSDFRQVEHLFSSPVGINMRQRLEAKGLVALAIWPNGFMHLTNDVHPIVRPADFRGLTFRVQAGEVQQDQFAAVGARTLVSSFSTVYANIENEKIDGQENTPNNIYTRNLHQVQPFLTVSEHRFLSYVVLAQAGWWRSLTPEMSTALQNALTQATNWVRQNAARINQEDLEKIRASGAVQVHTLTPAERRALQAAFEPAYQGAAKRLGSSYLNQVMDAVRRAR